MAQGLQEMEEGTFAGMVVITVPTAVMGAKAAIMPVMQAVEVQEAGAMPALAVKAKAAEDPMRAVQVQEAAAEVGRAVKVAVREHTKDRVQHNLLTGKQAQEDQVGIETIPMPASSLATLM
jgi:hypothetical protein